MKTKVLLLALLSGFVFSVAAQEYQPQVRTYYFKICAMAKVGKKNVYSPWSKVLEVTVK